MSFCHERTQYTPICPKIMFGCLLILFNPVKNIAPVGAQYMPILALIVKSSPRESRSDFSTRTHPIHYKMSKTHDLLLFDLFRSGKKHLTHMCQCSPVLTLIDKSLPCESRSDFWTRTHPIHSNLTKTYVLVLFELFCSG